VTNRIDDAFEVLKHIDVPKPQDTKSLCFKHSGSFIVADYRGRRIVLATIEFDDEPALVTSKVSDEPCYRNLPTKMSALCLRYTQLIPKLCLGIREIAAQMTCEVIGHYRDPHP
jgi:hypothetical protein